MPRSRTFYEKLRYRWDLVETFEKDGQTVARYRRVRRAVSSWFWLAVAGLVAVTTLVVLFGLTHHAKLA